MIKVTVSTQTKLNKSPYYYAVMHWIDPIEGDKYKWKSTKIKYIDEKQRRLFKQALQEANIIAESFRQELEDKLNIIPDTNTELDNLANQQFTDYLIQWANQKNITKGKSTSSGYSSNINGIIVPFFKNKLISLKDLKPTHLQEFYDAQYARVLTKGKNKGKLVSKNTVYHYHTTIHKALADAVKLGIIDVNPDDRTILVSPDNYTASYYNENEAYQLLELATDTDLELIINLAICYGLRRSEILGLKTTAIDLAKGTITIRHKVTQATINNKRVLVQEDKMKNKSSYRTLPLIDRVKKLIIKELDKQQINRTIFGNCYKNDSNYLCVKEDGEIMNPDTVTKNFRRFIEVNKLKKITLHQCRHSCGSILLANGLNMKEIQEWLGHSTYNVTANIYAHIDYKSKQTAANTMADLFDTRKSA